MENEQDPRHPYLLLNENCNAITSVEEVHMNVLTTTAPEGFAVGTSNLVGYAGVEEQQRAIS